MLTKICLIANPRTGSNRLCEVASCFSGMCGKYEIFHPENAWGVTPAEIAYINEIEGTSFQEIVDSNQPSFSQYRRENPEQFLKLLSQHASQNNHKYIFFKLFDGHISPENIRNFANDSDFRFIVLSRNTIDAYISTIKARETGKYTGTDTTNIIPAISRENFLNFQAKQIKWYSAAYLLASSKQDPLIIRYEGLFAQKGDSFNRVCELISRITGNTSIRQISNNTKRQDTATSWREKISNPGVIDKLIETHHVIENPADIIEKNYHSHKELND